jgi:HEAT repeat protein
LRQLADGADAVAAVPALEALSPLGEAEDDARLAAALLADDPEVVKIAAAGLGQRPAPLPGDALLHLERALAAPRWDVRNAAAEALGAHASASPRARAALERQAEVERDPLVVATLAEALGGAKT